MNIKQSIAKLLIGATLASTACVHGEEEKVDFNQVGKEMSKMLRNRHMEQLRFDETLSEKIFKLLIKQRDAPMLYFTQEDLNKLQNNYGKEIHRRLLQQQSTEVAEVVHNLYIQRVKERIAFAKKYLQETNFTFDSDRTVRRRGKKTVADQDYFSDWPKDQAAAESLWKNLVEEAVLSETLRRENIARLAKEQGKENPLKNSDPIKQLLNNRYERMLKSVTDEDSEDVANYLLSAVALAYGPHSDYFSAREYERFKAGISNKFVGIGALLQAEDDGATKITGIVVGGPAAKAGELQLNDRIVAVDHLNDGNMKDIMFMKINKVVEQIRGPKGSTVGLKIQRENGETKIIGIKRGKVEMNAAFATGEIIESKNSDLSIRKIGYIKLPSFYENCSSDVRKILERMVKEGINGLVFDLRGNGGGLLEEVRIMTGFFTGEGPVVQEKDFLGRVSTQGAYGTALYNAPMVTLIDKSSASASEILAGALQDYNRSVIVGSSSTFGKGTVQQPMSIARMLPFNTPGKNRAGYIKPTIRKFYRVSGGSTQKKGVEADIVLPDIYDILEIGEKYLDFPMPYDIIPKAYGYKPGNRSKLFLKNLKALNLKRVQNSKDFIYLKDEIQRMKTKIDENKIVLNKAKRLKELEEADQRKKTRNLERIKRFKIIQESDRQNLVFKRVNREDIGKPELEAFDPSVEDESYMKMAKNKTDDLDTTPEWPSRIDPVKRESLHIINDLINLTKKKTAHQASK